MVRVSAVTAWPAFTFFHGCGAPAVLVALFAKMCLASTEKSGYVAAEKALECDVLVSMHLASRWKILVAVQAVDALPRLCIIHLFISRCAFMLAGIARFIAIAVEECVRNKLTHTEAA